MNLIGKQVACPICEGKGYIIVKSGGMGLMPRAAADECENCNGTGRIPIRPATGVRHLSAR